MTFLSSEYIAHVVVIVLFLITTCLWLIKYAIERSFITEGIDLGKLEDEVTVYQNENMILRQQVLQEESLTTIEQKAKEMGFSESNNVYYIK